MFLKLICSMFGAVFGFELEEFHAYKNKNNNLIVMSRNETSILAATHKYLGRRLTLRQRTK